MTEQLKNEATEALHTLHEGSGPKRDLIMCVDDSKTIRQMLEALIPYCVSGFDVETAKDGMEAIEMLSSELGERVALVLSDVNMPKIDGLQLAQAIKGEISNLSDVPFVVFSGNSGDFLTPGTEDYDKVKSLMNDGFIDGVMSKPFMVPTLQRRILEAVEAVIERKNQDSQKFG